jgi:hypothetical protein
MKDTLIKLLLCDGNGVPIAEALSEAKGQSGNELVCICHAGPDSGSQTLFVLS